MWRLLDLGPVDGYVMTTLFEAVGRSVSEKSSPNTVILVHPKAPFVNVGFHQLIEKEIDVGYAREKGFDLVRRTIGGGAILDGPWEQDYFVVVNRKSRECPLSISEFYNKFLKPPLSVLRGYGLEAYIRKPNDILVGDQKISGNGAITIDDATVLAGDILLELPLDLMTRIINSPSEKYRDKIYSSMDQWLTSLKDQLGGVPSRDEVKQKLIDSFGVELGVSLEASDVTAAEKEYLDKLVQERSSEAWIFSKDQGYHSLIDTWAPRNTTIRSGVTVHEAVYKAAKLIRVTLIAQDGRIQGLSVSGDFFTQPYRGAISSLEKLLVGTLLEPQALGEKVAMAFKRIGLSLYGASPGDLSNAILKAYGAKEAE
ncbi:MAG: lipoyl protein ligase domain-containing protein [Candidatus Ranarchaeia archaeon]